MASSKRGISRSAATYSVPSPTCSSSTSEEDSMYSAASPKRSVRKETEQRRRILMNQYFDELVMMLSVVSDSVVPRKMDKASTLQEAVRVIRQYYHLDLASVVQEAKSDYRPGFLDRGEVLEFLLNALSAFLIVVCDNGRILFCTDLISSLTGHAPAKLIGQNMYDFVHEQDRCKLTSVFEIANSHPGFALPGSYIVGYPSTHFSCRLKLHSTESSVVDTSKDFSCLAYLRKWSKPDDLSPPSSPGGMAGSPPEPSKPLSCMLLLAKTGCSLANIDHPLTTNDINFSFEMRVSKEGKVLDMDKHASLVLGFTSWELTGSSFFDYVHPYHVQSVGEAMSTFLEKGLGVSQPYRIRTKSTQYLWIVSKGFLSYNPWNHKPDHILLQNKLLGSDEVIPEYRFASNVHNKPDMLGREDYVPPPITPQHSMGVTLSSQHGTMSGGVTHSKRAVSHSMPESSLQDIDLSFLPSSLGVLAANLGSETSQPTPATRLANHQQQSQSLDQQQQSQPPMMDHQPPNYQPQVVGSSSAPQTGSSTSTTAVGGGNLDEIQRQLEQKNKELFEMQCRILAQQQLFEQERNQFYQMTSHVMQFIGSQGQQMSDVLPPGMAMAVSMAGSVPPSAPSPGHPKQSVIGGTPYLLSPRLPKQSVMGSSSCLPSGHPEQSAINGSSCLPTGSTSSLPRTPHSHTSPSSQLAPTLQSNHTRQDQSDENALFEKLLMNVSGATSSHPFPQSISVSSHQPSPSSTAHTLLSSSLYSPANVSTDHTSRSSYPNGDNGLYAYRDPRVTVPVVSTVSTLSSPTTPTSPMQPLHSAHSASSRSVNQTGGPSQVQDFHNLF